MYKQISLVLFAALGAACSQNVEATSSQVANLEGSATFLLPRTVTCMKQDTIVSLRKYEVTATDLEAPEALILPREHGNDEPPWAVELSKQDFVLSDSSFLCDGYASITFKMKDAVAAPGTTTKDVLGENYYEIRGEESITPITCTFKY